MTAESIKPASRRKVPVEEGLFTMPESLGEKPRLIAGKCETCGEVFFPKRKVCLRCTCKDMEQVMLGTRGKIYTFTITRQAPPGSVIKAPYVLASIEMPEGVNIHTILADCDVDKVEVGQEAELVLETIKQDEAGRDVVAFKFKPV